MTDSGSGSYISTGTLEWMVVAQSDICKDMQ